MLPRLFFTHFRDTSFVAEDEAGGLAGFLCGFLCGFLSQTYPDEAYVHCVTAPVNTASVAFHRRLGFEIEAEVENYDGAGESRVLLVKRL